MKIYAYKGKDNLCGERIRLARAKNRITQSDLAARMQVAGVAIERDSISRIERGTRIVTDYELKIFSKALGVSMEWLELVVTCRSRTDYSHGYDIVEGKIANDNVGETVSYVMQGIMRKEDAIERLRFEQINNQIAFCTEAALHTLHFQNSYICGSVKP